MIRKRLAIFAPGGIGGGPFSQGQPAIAALVGRLAARFEVTFYSLARPDAGFVATGFRMRAPDGVSAAIPLRGVPWIETAGRFLADHAAAPFDATLALWGYPMGSAAVALSKLARVRSAVMLLGAETADLPAIGYGHLGRPLSRRLVLATCAQADVLIAVSRHQLRVLRAAGLQRDDAVVVPIGAEPELFPFVPPKPRTAPLKMLHVANLTEVKDQPTLIEGFARLRHQVDARLRIVGEDNLDGAIHALVRRLGLHDSIELVGPLPFAAMPEQYRWADLFVLTSLSEGQNRSLTEAAMSGVLQVSTPVGHLAEAGAGDMAVLVRAGDPADVAARVVEIARDPVSWQSKIARARTWASAHDMDWTAGRMTAIVEGLGAA